MSALWSVESMTQAMQAERLIMVTEADKPAQTCRVLKCWRDKDHNKVCQVQAIDSGEMITIVEPDGQFAHAGLPLNSPTGDECRHKSVLWCDVQPRAP